MSAQPPSVTGRIARWRVDELVAQGVPERDSPRSTLWLDDENAGLAAAGGAPPRLRAGIVSHEAPAFEETFHEEEASFIIEGAGDLELRAGPTLQLGPGTGVCIGSGSQGRWTTTLPMRRLVIQGGAGHGGRSEGATACRFDAPGFTTYGGDDVSAGSPQRSVRWLCTGAEGSGEFVCGFFTIEPTAYRKRFVVDEFIYMLEGEQRMTVDGVSVVLRAGDVARFRRGMNCEREVTARVRHFFAAR